jgi:hypothetical protein
MEVSDARRLKQLEDENRKLKRLVADLTLDKEDYAAPPELAAHHGPSLRVDPIDVEDVLRDIETDRRYLHRRSSRMVFAPDRGK